MTDFLQTTRFSASRFSAPHFWALFCLVTTLASVSLLCGSAIGQEDQPAGPTIRSLQDPAVTALLESNPQTPAELFRVVLLLTEIDRTVEARPFAARFLQAAPDAATLAAILRKHGSNSLMRLSKNTKLGDDGKKIVEMIQAGVAEHTLKAERIAKLVKDLSDPAPENRHAAIVDLAETGDAGISAMIAALADDANAENHRSIQQALVQLGAAAVDPLIRSLESDDDSFRALVVECLGASGQRRVAVHLAAPFAAPQSSAELRKAAQSALVALVGITPSRDSAELALRRKANIHLQQRRRFVTDLDDLVHVWRWDPEAKTVVRGRYPEAVLHAVTASRIGHDLFRMNPDRDANRRLYLLALLQEAELTDSMDAAAVAAKKLGTEMIDDALAEAIAAGHVAAATGAAKLLGTTGNVGLLNRAGGKYAPLVQAARHPNPRLRFAAVEAIMKLGPTKPYAGSSHVLEAIAFFASSGGARRALVVDPRANKAATLAGILKQAGFEADIATTGRGCQRLLRSSADYTFVMIDMGIDGPPVDKLVQQVRRDLRSSELPIGLLCEEGHDRHADRIAFDDPLTEAFPWPTTSKTVDYQLQRVLSFVARRAADAEERLVRSRQSLHWMGQISSQPQALYDVARHQVVAERGLAVPRLSDAAATVLAHLGTHGAQQKLVKLASQSARPLRMRQSASVAFATSVKRYGVQLTSDEIREQYDHYNKSRNLDRATQKILGSILDTLESRTGDVTTDDATTKEPANEKSAPNKN